MNTNPTQSKPNALRQTLEGALRQTGPLTVYVCDGCAFMFPTGPRQTTNPFERCDCGGRKHACAVVPK